SLISALVSAIEFHAFRREVRAAQERAEAAIRLAQEQGFTFWIAVSSLLRGWALAHQGQAQEGIPQIDHALIALPATGTAISRQPFRTLIADAQRTTGGLDAGLNVLNEALMLVDKTGERWCEAEIYRLQGDLLLQQNPDNQAEAETCFQHTIRIAQSQSAK